MPLALIESSQHVVLIAHQSPDADSLGSASAFYSYLLRLHKKVTFYCVSPTIERSCRFIPWCDKLTSKFPDIADLMISFDCGGFERLGVQSTLPLINFDHHRSNEMYGTLNVVDVNAISTTEVVYDFFRAHDIKINPKMATALYAGLLEDSNNFTHPAMNAKTYEMAGKLMEAGADHRACIDQLYRQRSLSSARLRGELLRGMDLFHDGAMAYFEISKSVMEATGAGVEDCKGILDEAMDLCTVRTALMSLEHPNGGIKLSLRSDGIVDAAKILSRWNGGGHTIRAGARLRDATDHEAAKEIIKIMKKEMM